MLSCLERSDRVVSSPGDAMVECVIAGSLGRPILCGSVSSRRAEGECMPLHEIAAAGCVC